MDKNTLKLFTEPTLRSNDCPVWIEWCIGAFLLALPFFVLYWLVPFVGKYSIGNDYQVFWIQQQMYLQFSIHQGTFPLYAPGFVGGWTASGLTLGQVWHPISWVSSHLPGYWSGYALQISTILRLLSLGGTHLVLFRLLQRLRLSMVLAFIISFITVYNLRMLDLFRYGTPFESYIAYLLLCTLLVCHYITPTKRLGPLGIAVATWLLVVSGHPQMMYLGLIGAALVCLVSPLYLPHLLPDEVLIERQRIGKYYLTAAFSVLVGLLLACHYILPFYFEYLSDCQRGLELGYNWSCGYQDTIGGSLSNFFNPFRSDVHGAFGGSALLLLPMLIPLLLLFRIRVPVPILCIWLGAVTIFLLILGSHGPLYYYFWKFVPFAENFRVPGRIALYFPFIFLLLLAWLARLKPQRYQILGWHIHLSPAVILAGIALEILTIFNSLPAECFKFCYYTPIRLNKIPILVFVLTNVSAHGCLAVLIVWSTYSRLRKTLTVVLLALVFTQTVATLRYGTWIVPSPEKLLAFEQIHQMQQEHATFPGYPGVGEGSLAVLERLRNKPLEPSLARISRNYTVVESTEEAYKHMTKEHSNRHLFIENFPVKQTNMALPISEGVDSIKLTYNTFNRLRFDVVCAQQAFFVFSYPYSKHWQAYINGESVPIYRSNGVEQAVWLPIGKNNLEFRYWSDAIVVGMVVSILVLFFVALSLLSGIRKPQVRRLAMIGAFGVCVFVFMIWYQSLYLGGSIGTKYSWSSPATQNYKSNGLIK